ncbi:MAG: phosphoserine phosphatase SerB [Sulfitobacter sp.]|jgi:phosphoserine phosphatase|uniref:phosphoserine phosphatase SerB n=1 Tax=unclassified Sulfitobacter TaxID=196795 RepID=UPI0007C2C6C0|nr:MULTISPECIES: phosphoserine phosphatase SerB [unclassified Sulfitobacter]KZX95755.1 phosphoserine phosphatase SerB [Sulfitobacter sp. HI0027]KZX98338.1 phosphoserine phosphatase SerB [Sulfitobacter sp. HI0021]KZZ02732.1 phosphoserine phosphatase SerB [Sulfitobacter sp. HI0076]
MFTAILLTSPFNPSLDAALVESLRNAWGGGDALWLAPDEAAEFSLAQLPENRWDVWESCQSMGVDLVIVPSEGRRKKMLLADMDSTMIQQECIDELAEEAGVGAHVKEITARAMNGELDFDGALRERVGLLKGLEAAVIDKVLAERITLMPGGGALVGTMKANSGYAALVSGGFTAFTAKVAEMLGFDENRANTLLVDGAALTGDVGMPILGREAKVTALEEITAKLGITEDQVVAVGDGANDLGMLGRAGMGVALHAKPSVAAECDIRVNFGDLTALLFVQGYARTEFAG